jgi:hypothetical protein
MTKLSKILSDRGMSQRDLQRAIFEKHGILYGDATISRIVNGIKKNYHLNMAKTISDTLGVTIDQIIEL